MTIPPERISIKRRRQDEPVETLLLEQAPSRDKKRRATDFLFRRLRIDEVEDVPPLPRLPGHGTNSKHEKHHSASQYDNPGIPQIRTTLPGEEVKDLRALKAAINAQRQTSDKEKSHLHNDVPRPSLPRGELVSRISSIKIPTNARRFHLSRELNILGPSKHGGIRKSMHRPKAQLATFIEKGLADFDRKSMVSSKSSPVNKLQKTNPTSISPKAERSTSGISGPRTGTLKKDISDQPFAKPSRTMAKTGRTINTHPDTWDFDSDQLASELAAFALELDPSGCDERGASFSGETSAVPASDPLMEDDYVYETYIRLSQNSDIQATIEKVRLATDIGILVIAEEDEELWEAFAEGDEDDDEWDEEDADSNAEDNPANDYPEDEVSSDDEFGLGAYKHRRNASDDEEFDVERDG